MADLQEIEERQNRRDHFEDEVELIDYLRVVWKWKWLILGGTLLCILAVAIYGFTRPVVKMYRVSALIEIDPKAKLDPLDRIKSMIEYGMFNQQVLKEVSNLQEISSPESLAFEVNIPKGLDVLDIAYKTPNVDLGKAVLNTLIKQLEQEYKERMEKSRSQFDENIKEKNQSIKSIQANIQQIKLTDGNNISRLKSRIKDIQANIQIIEKKLETNKLIKENEIITHTENIKRLRDNIRVVKNDIDEIKNVLQQVQSNREELANQRERIILDSKDKTGHRDVFMQSAAIQQVINYPVDLMDRIRSMSFKERDLSIKILSGSHNIKDLEAQIKILEMQKISSIQRELDRIRDLRTQIQLIELEANQNISLEENEIAVLKSEIESLKQDKDKITGLIVKQPPTASLLPIKYKAKRNTLLAGVVGFFLLIFLAFFIEYIKNASKRTQKTV